MKGVKGDGFGVRFYRRPVSRKYDMKASEKDTPPQEFFKPFQAPAVYPVYDIPEQNNHRAKAEAKIVHGFAAGGSGAIGFYEIERKVRAPYVGLSLRTEFQQVCNVRTIMPLSVQPYKIFAHVKKILANDVPSKTISKPRTIKTEEKQKTVSLEAVLWAAALKGDSPMIRKLVMEGVDLDARDDQGRTALNIAMQYNNTDAIKTLMAAKEMRRMAKVGDLPDSKFFRKFSKNKTGTNA